jgi:hypothetical protein
MPFVREARLAPCARGMLSKAGNFLAFQVGGSPVSWGRLIITHSLVPSSCPSSSDCISGRCPIGGRFFEPSSGLDCWCHRRQRARLSGNTDISRQSDRKLALPTLAHRAVDDLCYDVPEFPQLACGAVLDCCRVRRNLRAGELLRGVGARRTHGWSGGWGSGPVVFRRCQSIVPCGCVPDSG